MQPSEGEHILRVVAQSCSSGGVPRRQPAQGHVWEPLRCAAYCKHAIYANDPQVTPGPGWSGFDPDGHLSPGIQTDARTRIRAQGRPPVAPATAPDSMRGYGWRAPPSLHRVDEASVAIDGAREAGDGPRRSGAHARASGRRRPLQRRSVDRPRGLHDQARPPLRATTKRSLGGGLGLLVLQHLRRRTHARPGQPPAD